MAPDRRRNLLIVALLVHAVLVFLGWRDLSRRTDEQVRGPKLLWRILIALNSGNSIAYWTIGRKRAAAD